MGRRSPRSIRSNPLARAPTRSRGKPPAPAESRRPLVVQVQIASTHGRHSQLPTPSPNGPRSRPDRAPRQRVEGGDSPGRPVAGFADLSSPLQVNHRCVVIVIKKTPLSSWRDFKWSLLMPSVRRSTRAGTNGVVQEDVEGVVAAAFTHGTLGPGSATPLPCGGGDWGVVGFSTATWCTRPTSLRSSSCLSLSSATTPGRAPRSVVDRLIGVGLDGRSRRHSEQLRFEVTGVPPGPMAEFSQRSVAIEERRQRWSASSPSRWARTKECRGPSSPSVTSKFGQKQHDSLAEMTESGAGGRRSYIGDDEVLVARTATANDLPSARWKLTVWMDFR